MRLDLFCIYEFFHQQIQIQMYQRMVQEIFFLFPLFIHHVPFVVVEVVVDEYFIGPVKPNYFPR